MTNPAQQLRKRPPRKTKETESAQTQKASKKSTLITVVAISAVIICIIVIAYYMIRVLPFQRVIIKVENDKINIEYFLKRVMINPEGDNIWGTIENLTQELVIMQEAPKYGIEVTEKDIDNILREAARGGAESITDAEYKEWYRQQLNISQLSQKEYREFVRRTILKQQLNYLLAESIPPAGEQAHLYVIIVKTYEEAVKVKERVDGGEDFQILAKELSIDTSTKDQGGEFGWMPYGIIDDRYKSVITNLEIGVCSEPINTTPIDQGSYDPEQAAAIESFALMMITEKSASMEFSEDHLNILRSKALSEWLNEQMSIKKITFHSIRGGSTGFDSYTNSWLQLEIQKRRLAIKGTTG